MVFYYEHNESFREDFPVSIGIYKEIPHKIYIAIIEHTNLFNSCDLICSFFLSFSMNLLCLLLMYIKFEFHINK